MFPFTPPPPLSFLLLSTVPTLAHTYTVNLGSKVTIAELAAEVEKLIAHNKQLTGEVEKLTVHNTQLAGEKADQTQADVQRILADVLRVQKAMQSVISPVRKTLFSALAPATLVLLYSFVGGHLLS